MYSIVKNNVEIGVTERPIYIRLTEEGAYTPCEEAVSQGVAYESVPYHVWGKPEMKGTEDSVALVEINGGARLYAQGKAAKAALLTLADAEMVDSALPGIADAIADAHASLVSPPAQGDPWSATARYITGDTCTVDGVIYVAQRYSRGKSPADSPEHWQLAPTEPVYSAWTSIMDGTVIEVGTIVTHEGGTWRCTAQHIKSTVFRPKAGSSKWTAV